MKKALAIIGFTIIHTSLTNWLVYYSMMEILSVPIGTGESIGLLPLFLNKLGQIFMSPLMTFDLVPTLNNYWNLIWHFINSLLWVIAFYSMGCLALKIKGHLTMQSTRTEDTSAT